MTMTRALVWAGLLLVAPAPLWGFEGTLKLRSISVDRDQLGKVTGGKKPDTTETLAIMPDTIVGAKDTGAEVFVTNMYVSGPKVRMDAPIEKGKEGYAIIDTEKNMTWFVVPSEKRYIEWSEADAKVMSEKMAQLEKMMKERMGSLPPEQRAQAEQILKNMQGGNKKVNIKSTGKTQTVNGMEATAYEVKLDDETLVGWVTEQEPELTTMLRQVQQRMEKMTPPAMRGRHNARTALSDKGFPVMVQTIDPDTYRVEEITTVEKKPVSADLFVVPQDFQKTTGREAMNSIPAQQPAP